MVRKKATRRTRTEHRLVTLLNRKMIKGDVTYVYYAARWKEPDTGKVTEFKLDPAVLPTREARRQWCIAKSRAILKRRTEIAAGAPRVTRTPLGEAIAGYVTAAANRLRPATLTTYQKGFDKFLVWANDNGARTTEEITPGRLTVFRESLIAQRKKAIAPRGKRGARKATTDPLSPHSINKDIRSVKALLSYWRALGVLPHVTGEDLRRSLKTVSGTLDPPEHLPPADCRKLLERAIAHDSEVFDETRIEHVGLREKGTTPKYPSITPFVLFLLLSGLRVSEALNLRWADVDLDALDAEGRKVGEIRLAGADTKTKRGRTIGLEVAPSLREILAALKLQAGSNPFVFGGAAPLSRDIVESARKRLTGTYGSPRFSWQNLRQTTGTFLTNSPGIFGAASVFLSARQLGHSVQVAEKFYLGVVRGIPRDARTIEQAMQIEDLARKIVEEAGRPREAAIWRATNV